jgi:hypothetical protein
MTGDAEADAVKFALANGVDPKVNGRLAIPAPKEESPPTSGPLSHVAFVFSGLQLGAAHGELYERAGIGAASTETDVKTATTLEAIVATVPLELIVATLAPEPVVSSAPRNLVRTVAAKDAIASRAAENLVTPAARTDQVVAATALNLVSAAARNDDVAAGSSPELVGAGRSRDGCCESSALSQRGSSWRCGNRVKQGGRGYRDDRHSDLRAASQS